MISSPGATILLLLQKAESQGLRSLYLRNYEDLPESIGNDADILVGKGQTQAFLDLLPEIEQETGWKLYKAVQFAPLSLFFLHTETEDAFHLDIFESIEYHYIPYASAAQILARRCQRQEALFIPDPSDEIYLNVVTRLIYHGNIREKHEEQFAYFLETYGKEALLPSFKEFLGEDLGEKLFLLGSEKRWREAAALCEPIRRFCRKKAGFSLLPSYKNYLSRAFHRLLSPPGSFLCFEGADGTGKSTLIEKMLPFLEHLSGRKDTLIFHWKPTSANCSVGQLKKGAAQDPRAQSPRSLIASLLYLGYHTASFLLGYIRFVYPALTKNRFVLADRYTYDLWLDPARFRLKLPNWILKLFIQVLPRPDKTFLLHAPAGIILERKQELSPEEIEHYQEKLKALTSFCPEACLISAAGSPEEVCQETQQALLAR